MNFSLVSCIAAFAAISLVYAAEGEVCNDKIPCDEGLVCCGKMPSRPRPPRPPFGGGMGNMMQDMFDMMRPSGWFPSWNGGQQGRPSRPWPRPFQPPTMNMNGTCKSRGVGSDCEICLEISYITNDTTVSPPTEGTTSDGSPADGSPMSGPLWRPWSRQPGSGRKPRPSLCGKGLKCNPWTWKCEAQSTVAPSTTVATAAA